MKTPTKPSKQDASAAKPPQSQSVDRRAKTPQQLKKRGLEIAHRFAAMMDEALKKPES